MNFHIHYTSNKRLCACRIKEVGMQQTLRGPAASPKARHNAEEEERDNAEEDRLAEVYKVRQ
jgi:hypothetical protein